MFQMLKIVLMLKNLTNSFVPNKASVTNEDIYCFISMKANV